jgi:nitroimidazol reductase NimA-like FMN-containing flavoprotein (pyridoxamine 5'-phosphate oxidase superfamily)
MPLPPEVRELFDGANTAHVATLMRDAAPHSVPMWVGVEGDRLAVHLSLGKMEGCE